MNALPTTVPFRLRYPAFINLMCDFVNLNAMGGVDAGLLDGELGDAGGEPLAGSSAGEQIAG